MMSLVVVTILAITAVSAQNPAAANANNTAGIGPRPNIVDMSPKDLTAFRDAVARLQSSGEWVTIASDHGVPNAFCPHGVLSFLVWHRRYIARLEIALGLPLPYWDWTKPTANGPGLPIAATEATYVNGAGQTVPNPLLAGPTSVGTVTTRNVNAAFPHASLLSQENMVMAETSFAQFDQYLEAAHNDVHGAVGGSMNTLDFSASDPIFWLNHNNIDRIWYRWQVINKFAMYPSEARGALKDSLGTFSGDKIIQDLTGWMRNAPAPLVQTVVDTKEVSDGQVSKAGIPPPGTSAPGATTTQPTTIPVVSTVPQGMGGSQSTTAPSTAAPAVSMAPQGKGANATITSTATPSTNMASSNANGTQTAPVNHAMAPSFAMPSIIPTSQPSVVHVASKRPMNVMEKRFINNDPNPAPRPLQIPLNMEFKLVDSATRTNSEMPGYQATPRVVCVIKDVPATREPNRIDVYMKNVRVAIVYLFGMGDSGMDHKLDRVIDITIPYRGMLDECDFGQLSAQMSIQQYSEVTKLPVPTPSYTIGYEAMLF